MVVEIFSKCIHRQVHASLEQPLPVWGVMPPTDTEIM